MPEESAPSGGLVYHYTTAAGLKGIIENRCLWASNINFLNDASEYQHGLEILRGVIGALVPDAEALRNAGIELTDLRRQLAQVVLYAIVQSQLEMRDYSLSAFVVSFFDSPDLGSPNNRRDPGDTLEQWRAYGGDEASYCIGFDRSLLERYAVEQTHPNVISLAANCLYDLDEKKEELARIPKALEPCLPIFVGEGFDALRRFLSERVPSAERRGSTSAETKRIRETLAAFEETKAFRTSIAKLGETFPKFFGALVSLPALMKDTAFSAEREWRIVRFCYDLSQVRFRTVRAGLVPYVEVPIAEEAEPSRVIPGLIRRVVVGPLGAQSETQKAASLSAVRMLLSRCGIPVRSPDATDGVLVESSQIPYRR